MATSSLQSSTISSLSSSSPSVPLSNESPSPCSRTNLKFSLPNSYGRTRSLLRFSQRDCDFAEVNETGSVVDWQWPAFGNSRATGRREWLLAMALAGVLGSQGNALAEETAVVDGAPKTEVDDGVPKAEVVDGAPKTEAVNAPSLELYVDEKEGFKLLRPALWNKVEKAGATVLFEDPAKRGNTIGVVVNPVRIGSLKDFGTADVVAEKLLAAERKKPSTNDAQLVRVQERQANGDIPLYCLEYTLDSSRGQKRILSAVTVASKKLYILNIIYVDSAATPAPPAMAETFTQVLNSFDLVA